MVKAPSKTPASNQADMDSLTAGLGQLATAPAVTKPQPQPLKLKIKPWEIVLKPNPLSTPVFSSRFRTVAPEQKQQQDRRALALRKQLEADHQPQRSTYPAGNAPRPAAASSTHCFCSYCMARSNTPTPRGPAEGEVTSAPTAAAQPTSTQRKTVQTALAQQEEERKDRRREARRRNRRNKAARKQAEELRREEQLQEIQRQLDELKKLQSAAHRKPEPRAATAAGGAKAAQRNRPQADAQTEAGVGAKRGLEDAAPEAPAAPAAAPAATAPSSALFDHELAQLTAGFGGLSAGSERPFKRQATMQTAATAATASAPQAQEAGATATAPLSVLTQPLQAPSVTKGPDLFLLAVATALTPSGTGATATAPADPAATASPVASPDHSSSLALLDGSDDLAVAAAAVLAADAPVPAAATGPATSPGTPPAADSDGATNIAVPAALAPVLMIPTSAAVTGVPAGSGVVLACVSEALAVPAKMRIPTSSDAGNNAASAAAVDSAEQLTPDPTQPVLAASIARLTGPTAAAALEAPVPVPASASAGAAAAASGVSAVTAVPAGQMASPSAHATAAALLMLAADGEASQDAASDTPATAAAAAEAAELTAVLRKLSTNDAVNNGAQVLVVEPTA